MRVLFVTHTLPPPDRPLDNIGGMQRGALELHRTLAVHPRVELIPVVLHTSTRWEAVLTVAFIAKLLATLPAIARRERADVVFFSAPVTAIVLPTLRRRLGARPAACIAHGLDVTWQVPPYQRRLLRLFRVIDAVFPISRATAEESLSRGAPPERVHVIPFGVDTARFSAAPDRAGARRKVADRLGLPPDAFVLVGLGRQVKRKGTAWFVEHVLTTPSPARGRRWSGSARWPPPSPTASTSSGGSRRRTSSRSSAAATSSSCPTSPSRGTWRGRGW
jgi:phosphatidylinositol alpha-1,6-mannosyltransferase